MTPQLRAATNLHPSGGGPVFTPTLIAFGLRFAYAATATDPTARKATTKPPTTCRAEARSCGPRTPRKKMTASDETVPPLGGGRTPMCESNVLVRNVGRPAIRRSEVSRWRAMRFVPPFALEDERGAVNGATARGIRRE